MDKRKKWQRREALLASAAIVLMLWSCGGTEGDDEPPGRVADLTYFYDADAVMFTGRVSAGVQNEPPNTRILAWTSPGDDKFDGEAALYDFRYIHSGRLPPGTDGAAWLLAHFDSAPELTNEPLPKEAGRLQQLILPRFTTRQDMWFALRTYDEIGGESKISAVVGPVRIRRLSVPARPVEGYPGTAIAGFGAALDQAYDFNADSFPDFIVGSPAEGKAYLFVGPPTTALLRLTPNANNLLIYRTINEFLPAAIYTGDPAAEFGAVVAGLFKLNGDQHAEVAVGAPAFNSAQGRLYLDYGQSNASFEVLAEDMNLKITGENAGDRFSASIAPLFDLNADQTAEFAAGAPGWNGGRGKLYIFTGAGLGLGDKDAATTAKVAILGANAGDGVGTVVASAGDLNGDGLPDLAVAAPDYDAPGLADSGAVYIFYGSRAFLGRGEIDLSDAGVKADITIYGSHAGARFGRAMVAGGNLAGNNDPAGELAVAGGDTVYVFVGGPNGTFNLSTLGLDYNDIDAPIQLGRPGGQFGHALAAPGDLDRDTVNELVITDPGSNEVYIFYGPLTTLTSGMTPDEILSGAGGFGAAAAGLADGNKDGYPDLLLSAPGAGEVYFVF